MSWQDPNTADRAPSPRDLCNWCNHAYRWHAPDKGCGWPHDRDWCACVEFVPKAAEGGLR